MLTISKKLFYFLLNLAKKMVTVDNFLPLVYVYYCKLL